MHSKSRDVADKRWRGALFDLGVFFMLGAVASGLAVWVAVPITSAAKWLLARLGVV